MVKGRKNMPSERFTITMSSDDIDAFERGRSITGMSKSAYIRLLIAEHENTVPSFIRYKEIIREISDLNTNIKEILLSDKEKDSDKLLLIERMNEIKQVLKNVVSL